VKELKRKRVLVVDDSPVVRKRVAALLNNIVGVEVVGQAGDTVEAIASTRQLKPDVVVLDVRIPGGGGLGVLESLRKEKPGPTVIILTDYPFAQYRKKCLEMGASFFFDKASEFYKLKEAFEQLQAQSDAPGEAYSILPGKETQSYEPGNRMAEGPVHPEIERTLPKRGGVAEDSASNDGPNSNRSFTEHISVFAGKNEVACYAS